MARRYFNWKLLVIIILASLVLGLTAYGLRKWQRSQKAEVGLAKGLEAYQQKDWENAAMNLGTYLPTSPDDVDILHKYAESQLNIRPVNRNHIQQAIAAYRNILRAKKDDLEAVKKLASIYIQMNMAGEAELILSRFPGVDTDPELGRLLAVSLMNQRKFNDAAKKLQDIIKAYPDQVQAYQIIAQLAAQRPDSVSLAPQEWYNKAVENNPQSAAALTARAAYRFSTGDASGANADLDKALTLKVEENDQRLRLAAVLIGASRPDAAAEYLDQVKSEDPQNDVLWRSYVQLARTSGDNSKVLKVVEEGLETLAPDNWDFMPLAAEMYVRCDDMESAGQCISRLKDKEINPGKVTLLEAMVADKTGNAFESVKAWKAAVLAGNNSANNRLRLALAYIRTEDTVSAVKELNSIVSDHPNYLPAHLTLARQAFQTRDLQTAAEHAAIAKRLAPKNPEVNSLYVQTQIQLLASGDSAMTSQSLAELEAQIAELEKDPAGAVQAGLMRFSIALGKADYKAAEKILNDLKKDYPENVKISMAFAELYVNQRMSEKTISVLQETIEKFPQEHEPVRFLASFFAVDNQPEKSREVLEEAINRLENRYDKLELAFMLAGVLRQLDMQDEHYELLNGFAAKYPDNIRLKTMLLTCPRVSGDQQLSQQIIDQIGSLAGQDSWQRRYYQAKLWYDSESFKDHYSSIISFLKQNVMENPNDQQSRLLLANAHEKGGDIQLALSTYREAFDRSPNDLRIMIPMVSALYRAQEYQLADEILSSASEENLDNPQISRMRMHSYLRHGEYSQASELLRSSLAKNPEDSDNRFSLAMLELQQQNFAEASSMLESLRKQRPDSKPVIAAQIKLNLIQKNNEEAIRICDEVVQKDNDAASHILRARTLATLQMNDEALADLHKAVELEPEDIDVWIARSNFYGSIGEVDKALADIQHAVELDDKNLTAKKIAIEMMLSAGDSDYLKLGKDMLNKAIASNPEDIDLKFYQSRVLMAGGTAPGYDQAVEILQAVTDKEPANVRAWSLLAQIALVRSEHGRAIDYSLRGLSRNPNNKELLLLKARAESSRSPSLAIPTLRTLYELDPANVENAVFLASAYIQAGQPGRAIELLTPKLDSNISDNLKLRCRIVLANAAYSTGNKARAAEEFSSLIDSEEAGAAALSTYCQLLAEDKNYDEYLTQVTSWTAKNPEKIDTVINIIEGFVMSGTRSPELLGIAEKALQKVIDVSPGRAQGLKAMAVLYQMTDKNTEAAQLYEKILEITPDDVIVINNLAWALCDQQGKYRQALELANRGLELAPEYTDLIDTRGVIYHNLDKFDLAIADFQKCLRLYPSNNPAVISTRLHLARSLAKTGRTQDAISQLNTALSAGTRMQGVSQKDLSEARNLLNELSISR